MAIFESELNKIPEVDPTKLDNITTLVTTFEEKDLVTRNVMNFLYDEKTDYVFIDFWSLVNGKSVSDFITGYDKNKVLTVCENIINYFKNKKPS
jgi:predicted SnoaL-like aldol condensation-catalyzing enzyme